MSRLALITLAAVASLSARAATLEDVLARMDNAARSFKSYSASAKVLNYTKFADDTYEQTGSFRLRRIKSGIGGIMDLSAGKDRTVYHFNGPEVEEYKPKAMEIRVYKTLQYGAMVNRMLLLGFSVTRDQMKKDYTIELKGSEPVDSTLTAHIVLTPKSAEALKVFKTVELWIPDGAGYTLQQKETAPNKDYKLVKYSNLQLNPSLPDSDFELQTPSGVQRILMN